MIKGVRTAAVQRRTALPCALLLVVLCVALASCGDLPRPFQPAEKSLQAWSAPGDIAWGSILVLPITGLPQPQSAALADEVVDALQVRDVPASRYASGRGSIVLVGQVSAVTRRLKWALVTPDGETALRFEEPQLDAARLGESAPDLAAIAARAARRIAVLLEPPTAEDERARPAFSVALAGVRGAPGDGGIALARAMHRSLTRIGVAIADDGGAGSHWITGRVSVARDEGVVDDAALTIAWDVLHPDGTKLGTVTQSNRVSAAQLTGTWSALASIVARAGAPGIAQLLEHAQAPQMAQATRRAAPAKSPLESPPAPRAEASSPLIEAPAFSLARAPIEAPIALRVETRSTAPAATIEARAAPLELPAETSPTPLVRPLPLPPTRPRPEAPIAVSIVVSAALR